MSEPGFAYCGTGRGAKSKHVSGSIGDSSHTRSRSHVPAQRRCRSRRPPRCSRSEITALSEVDSLRHSPRAKPSWPLRPAAIQNSWNEITSLRISPSSGLLTSLGRPTDVQHSPAVVGARGEGLRSILGSGSEGLAATGCRSRPATGCRSRAEVAVLPTGGEGTPVGLGAGAASLGSPPKIGVRSKQKDHDAVRPGPPRLLSSNPLVHKRLSDCLAVRAQRPTARPRRFCPA